MKISFFISGLGVGGAERVVCDLADQLDQRGFLVSIVYFGGEALVRPKSSRVKLLNLGIRSSSEIVRALKLIVRYLKTEMPDVVHAHMVHANLVTRVARLFANIPCLISTAHNKNEEGRLRMLGYRLTDRLASISTNVCDEAVEAFIEQGAVSKGRMITVYNGIDTARFCRDSEAESQVREEFSIPKGKKIIAAIGRLFEQKDYPNLINSLKFISADFMLLIVGEGILRSELEIMVQREGLGHAVKFIGLRTDIPRILSAADVFVLSSAWEGFPMVIGEAMSVGAYVVATDCGGVREFLGDCGSIVPVKDPKALGLSIQAALTLDRNEYNSATNAARNRVNSCYSLSASVDRWISIYQSFLR